MTTVRVIVAVGEYVSRGIPRGVIGDSWNSPLIQWPRRLNAFYLPDRKINSFVWLPESVPAGGVLSIEPNQPETGDTRVTFAVPGRPGFSMFRTVGDEIRIAFSGTGVANLDGVDHVQAEVLVVGNAATNPVVALRGLVASSSSTSGIGLVGTLYRYGDDTGHVDATHGGAFPSVESGLDYRMVQVVQDAIGVGDDEDEPIVLVSLCTTEYGLRARGSDQRPRWLAEFESSAGLSDGTFVPVGANLSIFADLRSIVRDMKAGIVGTFGISEDDFEAIGIVVSCGLYEGRIGTQTAARAIRSVSAFALDGDDLLVTTSVAHGVAAHVSGTPWQVARIAGLTTDPDGVAGRIVEVDYVSATQLRIRDFAATEIPTFASGAATIEHGDPGFWVGDDALDYVDSLRAMVADEFPQNDPDAIPTVVLVPDRKDRTTIDESIRRALLALPSRREALTTHDLAGLDRQSHGDYDIAETWPQASCTVAWSVETGWLLSRVGGGLVDLGVLAVLRLYFAGDAEYTYVAIGQVISDSLVRLTNNANPASSNFGRIAIDGLYIGLPLTARTTDALAWRIVHDQSPTLYSLGAMLDLGADVGGKILDPVAPSVASERAPAIVIGFAAHSYGVGVLARTFIDDNDPDLVSSETDPHIGERIWNPSSEAWEDVRLYQSAAGLVSNYNRHPEWNWAQIFPGGESVASQPSLLHGARERFPDETVHLINLAANGATLAIASADRAPLSISRALIQPGALLLELSSFTGAALLDRDLVVAVAGISGVTPSPNGTHASARLSFISGSARQWIAIPGSYSGTPVTSGATLGIRPPSWHPSAGELFDSWALMTTQAYDALWQSGRVPDFRALFVDLGLNDAADDTVDEFADALDAFVPAMRDVLRTLGLPRAWDVPIVWLAPIVHERLSSETLAHVLSIRANLAARAAADPAFRVLALDESADWLLDSVPISGDDVHPTFSAYRERGYRAARQGLALISGFDGLAPADFTPQTPVDVTP